MPQRIILLVFWHDLVNVICFQKSDGTSLRMCLGWALQCFLNYEFAYILSWLFAKLKLGLIDIYWSIILYCFLVCSLKWLILICGCNLKPIYSIVNEHILHFLIYSLSCYVTCRRKLINFLLWRKLGEASMQKSAIGRIIGTLTFCCMQWGIKILIR